jgi:UDP-glucose 4-epimerase
MRTILVTGASTWVGGRLVQRLEARPETTVVPVDELTPRVSFVTPLVKASLDTLEFARTVIDIRPDVVIHLQTLDRTAELGRVRAREGMVLGAQALFGAISRVGTVRQVLVKSDTAIYGAGPRHPSILNETTEVAERTTTRYERSLEEVERFVADVAGKMPDVAFTVLRFVGIFGEAVGNGISHYLRLPSVPTNLGWDPRLQLIHEDEAVRAVVHALDHPIAGTFNVAADGQLYLSRILRLGRRRVRPVPRQQFERALRVLGAGELAKQRHLLSLLQHGRVVDTTRMREILGFSSLLDCRQTVLAGYGRLDPALAI